MGESVAACHNVQACRSLIGMTENSPEESIIHELADGRTDLVFDLVSSGYPPNTKDPEGVSLINWCAYYGDLSAIRFLLSQGETLHSLGTSRSFCSIVSWILAPV
jgi:ankyrin repeat protein